MAKDKLKDRDHPAAAKGAGERGTAAEGAGGADGAEPVRDE